MPGIIAQSIDFGGFVTALGLSEDVHKGLIDRFRSLPMSRAAVLNGRTSSDILLNCLSLVVLLATGLALTAYGIVQTDVWGWGSGRFLGTLTVALALIASTFFAVA